MFLHPVLVLDLNSILALILLLHLLEAEDDLVWPGGPTLAPGLGGQVFRALWRMEDLKLWGLPDHQLTLNHVTWGMGSPTISRTKYALSPSVADTLSAGFTYFGSFPLAARGVEALSQSYSGEKHEGKTSIIRTEQTKLLSEHYY